MANALSQLHPAAQVFAIIAIAAVVCVAVWQFFKTLREL
jgi:hypothetical protein